MRRIELPAQVPELLGVSVETVTEIEGGWDYAVFEVNGTWIVRVPRRPEVRAWLRKEARLLPELAPTLPLPVPEFEVTHHDPDLRFVAYRRIEGDPIDQFLQQPVDARALGEHLGRFLASVHAFPLPRAGELTRTDGTTWMRELHLLRDECEGTVFPRLSPEERDRATRMFDEFFEGATSVQATLVHADLGPDHILCSHDSVTGVIDWSDACIGDAAIDFGWLLHSTPSVFVEGIRAGYAGDGRSVEPLLDRSLFYHRVGPWHEVLYGVEQRLQPLVERGLREVRERLPFAPSSASR
jgi:aminoglycoside phosphotransferase (APT) family kinase protein